MKDELDKRLQLMTISVIIPVYNASATLFHCLESLDRQTYRNLELLLVDDCSTDESLHILMSYVEQQSNPDFTIRILRHEENRVWFIAHRDSPGLQAQGTEQPPAGIAGDDP